MAAGDKAAKAVCKVCAGNGRVYVAVDGRTLIPFQEIDGGGGHRHLSLHDRIARVGMRPPQACPECSGGTKVVAKAAATGGPPPTLGTVTDPNADTDGGMAKGK